MTIGEALDRAVEQWGTRPALIVRHQDIRWTYNELAEKSAALAEGLLAMGLKPGERIGIWAPNCWEWTVTQFATARAGMILVNINPAYRLSELEYALNKVGCAALISADKFKSSDYIAMLGKLLPELAEIGEGPLASAKAPELRHVIRLGKEQTPGMINFGDVLQAGEISAAGLLDAVSGLTPSDPINIQFTSGTTGTPKGATLTHHNILNNAAMNADVLGLTEQDSVCIPVPLYHCFGMVMGNLAC
ncbi:MAG: AMP-binding protein, partial [Chloroflexi bacterium]|nr:AMP-binding protein [Chloroflexota bacterium]